jgi:hypothetical protein
VLISLNVSSASSFPVLSSLVISVCEPSMLVYVVFLVFGPLGLVYLVDFPIWLPHVVVFGGVRDIVVVVVIGFGRGGFGFPVIGLREFRVQFILVVAVVAVVTIVDVLIGVGVVFV